MLRSIFPRGTPANVPALDSRSAQAPRLGGRGWRGPEVPGNVSGLVRAAAAAGATDVARARHGLRRTVSLSTARRTRKAGRGCGLARFGIAARCPRPLPATRLSCFAGCLFEERVMECRKPTIEPTECSLVARRAGMATARPLANWRGGTSGPCMPRPCGGWATTPRPRKCARKCWFGRCRRFRNCASPRRSAPGCRPWPTGWPSTGPCASGPCRRTEPDMLAATCVDVGDPAHHGAGPRAASQVRAGLGRLGRLDRETLVAFYVAGAVAGRDEPGVSLAGRHDQAAAARGSQAAGQRAGGDGRRLNGGAVVRVRARPAVRRRGRRHYPSARGGAACRIAARRPGPASRRSSHSAQRHDVHKQG